MIIIKYLPERSEDDGQFYLGIAEYVELHDLEINRLGYYCDAAHLQSQIASMQRELDKHHKCPVCGK